MVGPRLILILLCCFHLPVLHAQDKLYFFNESKRKVIEVKVGQHLSLKYKGYLGQPEFAKQTVTDINDSMVTLGIDPESLGGVGKMLSDNPNFIYRKILLRDIMSFRRMTLGRQMLKATLVVANVVGTYYLLTALFNRNKFEPGETLLISLGVGIGTSVIINSLLPETPKYRMESGWRVSTMKPVL